jgi:hypothetical protein
VGCELWGVPRAVAGGRCIYERALLAHTMSQVLRVVFSIVSRLYLSFKVIIFSVHPTFAHKSPQQLEDASPPAW